MNKRVLITGGAGFIGYHLARELLIRKDSEIVLIDNFSRGRRDVDFELLVAQPRIRFVEADLLLGEGLADVGDFDEVYHLAGLVGVENVLKRPDDVIRINGLGTLRVLEWFISGGGKRFFFASTSEAYAWTQHFHPLPVPTPEDVPLALTDLANPRSSYAGSKIFGELAVTHLCTQAGLPYTIARFHNVYGPRMGYQHVIPELYGRIRVGQSPLTVFAADHRRAFCYVRDAVALMLLAVRGAVTQSQTLNIGNDQEEITIRELAEHLQRFAKSKAEINFQPAQNDPIERRCPDMSRARATFDYEPQWPLDRGLAETLAWYDANGEKAERS